MSKKLSKSTTPEALEAAFAHFNTVTDDLIKAYQQLEIKVEELNSQLVQANNKLLLKSQANALLAQRLSALVNALPAGVVETDAEGKIISINSAAKTMLPEVVETDEWPHSQLSSKMDMDGVVQLMDTTSGLARHLTIQTCPLNDRSNIYLLHDISALQQLHKQLAQQNKLASMGQMAASLAHQLRTPLATALLYAKNLERPNLSPDEQQRFSKKIVNRLQALEGLIREMLGFVKQSTPTEQTVAYHLENLIEEVEQSFAPQCESQAHHFRIIRNYDNKTTLTCRPKELVSAVINLLENALEHTSATGEITLEVQTDTNDLTLNVKDSGSGVPQELISRIFEPFFTTRANGTGLGLAIAKRVIDNLNGKLSYHHDGSHTIFSITLPKDR